MTKTTRRTSRKTASTQKVLQRPFSFSVLLTGAVVLLAVVIVLVLAATNQQPTVEASDYSGIPAAWQDRNVLGDPDASVTVQAWEDFLCPACAAFNQRVKPQLVENYIATGKVKLEFRHFPLRQHEPGASLAAQANECAADQGAFWPYHDRTFQAAPSGQSAFTAERLIDYAQELGLAQDSFAQCLTSQKYLSTVQESAQAAQAAGLNSTPSILINGVRSNSPLDYEAVAAAIDALLQADE